MLTSIINAIITFIAFVANAVFSILPDSPFQWSITNTIKSMPFINVVFYFIPFEGMISMTMAYTAAVVGYYAVRWVLRIIKLVGD